MLTAIRSHTKSIVVKALAGLLVASFALWGVSDMFTPGSSPSLAFEVGDVEIGPREVEYDVRREHIAKPLWALFPGVLATPSPTLTLRDVPC